MRLIYGCVLYTRNYGIVFINSLILELKTSNLCCAIERVQTAPFGYADDLATCTLSGDKLQKAMNIVECHGRTWRYTFNAKKSAVMVFGESSAEAVHGSANRMFKFKTSACPRFCKRRVLFCTQVRSMGVKIPLQSTKYTRL